MSLFLEHAKKSIIKNQDLLNALEEYDRTRKLRKISYKVRANFTVDEDLFNLFRSYCKKSGINMSAKVESCMRKELEKNQLS